MYIGINPITLHNICMSMPLCAAISDFLTPGAGYFCQGAQMGDGRNPSTDGTLSGGVSNDVEQEGVDYNYI